MTKGPLIVSFVGSSGVGKTTVVEQLIPLVRAAGLRVGTVKHAPHGHDVDRVGSDSWRHRRAGADAVLLAGADGAVLFLTPPRPGPDAPAPSAHHTPDESAAVNRITELVGRHLADLDVVLAEGFAPLHDLLIEVRRKDVPAKARSGPREVWLAITDEPAGHRNEYGFDEMASIAGRIVDRTRASNPEPSSRIGT